ncbi:hypothetical protein Barb6_03463 [Bacteroidales bacterium Barb6]|nr:hypothetical protein Barb6_03463 [Bacteroidales bacterium Barb6]
METIVISRRKFTGNFDTYFKKIEEGAQIILKWGDNKQAMIVPAKEAKDDTCYTREEWDAKIEKSWQEYKAGNVATGQTHEIDTFALWTQYIVI